MEPIDYNSPLGVSKREWAKVLGANLALLILVYVIALICTLCGSNLFLLNFHSDDLQRIEETLRGWNCYFLIPMMFATIEEIIILTYVCNRKPKWWWVIGFFAFSLTNYFLFYFITKDAPSWLASANGIVVALVFPLVVCKHDKRNILITLARFGISLVVTFILNEGIAIFRIKISELYQLSIGNSSLLVLSIEYDLALALTLGFLALIIPWEKGEKPCPTMEDAGGSSPNTTNSSRKPSKIAKTNLPPKYRKRLRWLKAKVIAIQTIALIVIAALPWFTGRPVEFALVYASFCMTRLMLGFNRSLHFKSELSCVTIGALCFWALTFLTPSVEVLIILSLCYGAGLALGFRLYWELHDLMMYRKASKTDRYAMLYVVFKGNCDPKHINGVMRAKGYADKDEIKMTQMYMQREKVDYIADWIGYAKITVEKKLTEIATDLYARR